jgi:hypothetical protein
VLILLRLTYFYIYNLPNLSRIKFLENLLAELKGSGVSGVFPGKSGFPGYSGPGPETLGCKGINTFYRGQKVPFILFTV